MLDRATERVRKAMGFAHQEAVRLRHDHIGTEHLLLGLLVEGSGIAASVLQDLGIDLGKVRAEVEKHYGKGSAESPIPNHFASDAHKALDYTVQEARGLGHNYVGTEHLLLGLLRGEDSAAAQLMISLGVRHEDVGRQVIDLLGAEPEDSFARVKFARAKTERTGRPAPVKGRMRGHRGVKAVNGDTMGLLGDTQERAPLAVDLAQAARMLSVSVKTVRREIDRRKLRAFRIGRVRRVRVAEIEAYLRRQERSENGP